MITLPYVTTDAFKAHPTFLDLLNLRSGDSSLADQTAELYNILLMASAWADNYVELGTGASLGAHSRTENARLRTSRDGALKYHPDHKPVISLTGLLTGTTPNSLSALTDFSQVWIEDGSQIIVFATSSLTSNAGPLQFGSPSFATELYTQWTYTAGYANTLLTNSPSSGATSIVVADATGITAGTVLRIWEPGKEEAIIVAGTYMSGTTIPLASPLLNSHTANAGVSALPADIHLAVILYATALLLRPDTAQDDAFPDAHTAASTRSGDSRKDGSGLVEEAERLLDPYRRVR